MIALFIVILFYFNLVRYVELRDLTNLYTIKDYWKYNGGISKVINFTIVILFAIGYFLINVFP